MDAANLNWWGMLLAAVSGFAIGGIWYSPLLFGNVWAKLAGLSDEQITNSNKAKIFGFSFLFLAVAAVNLGFFLADDSIGAAQGALYGFLTGFGWVLMAHAVTGLFELKPWRLIFINGGYWMVTLTVMGLIIGALK